MVRLMKMEIQQQTSSGLSAVVDMDDWSSRVALDIITEAGFGACFDALNQPFNNLNKWYREAFIVDENTRAMFMLSVMTSPSVTNCLPFKRIKQKIGGLKGVRKWARALIADRQAKIRAEGLNSAYAERHKDLISTLIKSGTLSTDGLVEQALTFLGAGHGMRSLLIEVVLGY